jgi:carbamoyltransferase
MSQILFEYHPEIGYRFIPNLKERIMHESGGYLLRTNSQGFRSDFEFEKNKTKKRVLLFGDSFTAADGVSNNKRYSDLLQKRHDDLEVYNFGLPGSGTDQQYLIYREYGKIYDCDLIIISVLVENIRRVNSKYRYYFDGDGNELVQEKPYFEIEHGDLKLSNIPVSKKPLNPENLNKTERLQIDTGGRFQFIRNLIIKFGFKEIFQRILKYQPVPEYSKSSNREWVKMKMILEKWIDEIDVPVIIMPIPLYQHIEGTSGFSAVRKRFEELKSPKVEISDLMWHIEKSEIVNKRDFRFVNDVHPTPLFHEVIANNLNSLIIKYLY